jgi:DSF synthase
MQASRISPAKPNTTHIRLDHDSQTNVFWAQMHASEAQKARPCCSEQLIEEALDIQTYINRMQVLRQDAEDDNLLAHLVVASEAPSTFCLGGDLALFARAIRNRDRDTLEAYALRCVDVVHGFQSIADGTTHTIALIQGDAMGGGVELALACNTIIAEEGSMLAFPEAYFGLFPGMGAYPFLCKRVAPMVAKRMLLDRHTYSAEEMKALGVVDFLVKPGAGFEAADQFIAQQRRSQVAQVAVARIHHAYEQVTLEALQVMTRSWVDCAMRLQPKQLAMMERLLTAQCNRFTAPRSLDLRIAL